MFALPVVVLPSVAFSLATREQCVHRTTFAMGTMVSIQAYDADVRLVHHAINKAFDEVRRFDALFSVYNAESEISKINNLAGKDDYPVSGETMELISHALSFAQTTNGMFDCTVEPLMRLWGFRNEAQQLVHIPPKREINKILDAVGYQHISINHREQRIGLLKQGAAIDLGGIAVGYTVDRMAAILRREGISSAFINHSGDVYAIGSPPDNVGWPVVVPSPEKHSEHAYTTILRDQAMSTSGSQEKFVSIEGKRYCHIIDVTSGMPTASIKSVSVIAPTSLLADVYSTTFFVDGPQSLPTSKNNGTKLELILVSNQTTIEKTLFIE